jgi:hypothetical protein
MFPCTYLVFHVKALIFFLLTSKGVNNIFIHELISYQQGYLIIF